MISDKLFWDIVLIVLSIATIIMFHIRIKDKCDYY